MATDIIRESGDARQLPVLWKDVSGDGTVYALQIYSANGGGGGGGADRELVVSTYRANKNFTGAVTGNLITSTKMFDVTGAAPTQVGATAWRNETQDTVLTSAPLAADLDLAGGGGGATNAEMTSLFAAQNDLIGAQNSSQTGTPSQAASLNGLLRGIWANSLGKYDDPATTSPDTQGTLISKISGLWKALLGVASGAADSGNPVKVGGKYNSTDVVLTDGQRGDAQLGRNGQIVQSRQKSSSAVSDAVPNTLVLHDLDKTGNDRVDYSANAHYNGATWDRMRGTIRGTWVEGAIAAAAVDSGNPVKVGGKFNATPISLTDGNRSDLQTNRSGALMVAPESSTANASDALGNVSTGFSRGRNNTDYLQVYGNMVYNGASWDRMRGDTTGLATNVLKAPLAAKQLAVTATSNAVALTAGTKRVSIYARATDMRFVVLNATGAAIATTSNFIAAGERLEFDVVTIGTTPWLAAIRDSLVTADGQLEITELS